MLSTRYNNGWQMHETFWRVEENERATHTGKTSNRSFFTLWPRALEIINWLSPLRFCHYGEQYGRERSSSAACSSGVFCARCALIMRMHRCVLIISARKFELDNSQHLCASILKYFIECRR